MQIMLAENIIGRDGKKSRMDHKAKLAKVLDYETPIEERDGQPKQMGTRVPRSRKLPGPPPQKNSQQKER